MKKVKGILFKFELKGEGGVQYDHPDQKYAFNSMSRDSEYIKYDNVQFLKKKYYLIGHDDEGKPIFKKVPCISPDGIRHGIHKNDMPFQSPNIFSCIPLYYKMRAQVGSLLRGDMTVKEGLKSKSCYSITAAEVTNGAIPVFEANSRSGARGDQDKNNGDNSKEKALKDSEILDKAIKKDAEADTSFFKRETIGKTVYEGKGFVDLMEMSFISLSDLYDRMSINPDHFPLYFRPELEKTFKSPVSDPAYYVMSNSCIFTPERGIVLSNDQILFLTREFFKRLLGLFITKSSGGYAETSKVEIKFMSDPIEDKMNSDEGWIELKTLDDINNISFEADKFYDLVPEEEAEGVISVMKAKMAEVKQQGQDKRRDKREKKEKAMAEKKPKKSMKDEPL